jgi:hypothetical protein
MSFMLEWALPVQFRQRHLHFPFRGAEKLYAAY